MRIHCGRIAFQPFTRLDCRVSLGYSEGMRKLVLMAILTILARADLLALGPHEVALIVNSNSATSLKLAREYALTRGIPHGNIVPVDGLDEDPQLTISADNFTAKIWKPVNTTLKERNLEERILVWVYSSCFPTTVSTQPAMSITGMTFLRAAPPKDPNEIEKALYASRLFADPVRPGARGYRSRSFENLKSIHRGDMPLPAFLLAYTGTRGNTAEEALAYLKRGAAADFTAPTGTVYFVRSEGVRSKAREWQFSGTAHELRNSGLSSIITSAPPQDRNDILGVMMGAPQVEPGQMGRFLAGSFADHLTSFGAMFQSGDQTKCTEWLRAGATGSAGTVVEPLSAWPKFPHARIFVHYAAGCTLIESFYQSVRSPLQILPVGDPLCNPWAPRPAITLTGLADEPIELPATLSAEVSYQNPLHLADTEWYVDDKLLGKDASLTLEPGDLTAGKHTLRIVALKTGTVRSQGYLLREFTVTGK